MKITWVLWGVVALWGCAPTGQEDSTTEGLSAAATIVSAIGGKCLDDDSGTANGSKAQLWDCNGSAAQQWTYTNGTLIGEGGKCLNITGNVQANGTVVDLSPCNGTTAQQWTFSGSSIKSSKGLCLDVTRGQNVDGAPLQMWSCQTNNANQEWTRGTGTCAAGNVTWKNLCYPSTRSCTVANGTGREAFINGAYGACVATSCNAGYSPSLASCVANATATVVSTCGEITAPGTYVLASNLVYANTSWGTYCLNIHDVSNVNLDCRGHSITTGYGAIMMSNVKSSTVANCTAANPAPASESAPVIVDLDDLSNDTFVGNTFGESTSGNMYQVSLMDSDHVSFVKNTLVAMTNQTGSSYTSYISNVSICPVFEPGLPLPGNFSSSHCDHTSWVNNNIDGRAPPNQSTVPLTSIIGTDDGIIMSNDGAGQYIAANTITRCWDTGVEWAGPLDNLTITNNSISAAGKTGIGCYFSPGLENSAISFNSVTTSVAFLEINAVNPSVDEDQKTITFANNTFDGNVFTNPVSPFANAPTSYLPPLATEIFDLQSTSIPSSTITFANNVFTNNNFGHGSPLEWCESPGCVGGGAFLSTWVIDGGGNICWQASAPFPTPLVCH